MGRSAYRQALSMWLLNPLAGQARPLHTGTRERILERERRPRVSMEPAESNGGGRPINLNDCYQWQQCVIASPLGGIGRALYPFRLRVFLRCRARRQLRGEPELG